MKLSKILFIYLFYSLISSSFLLAQEDELLISQSEKEAFIKKASVRLIDRYVFREVGENVAAYITSQFKAGEYDSITKALNFSRIMTEEIQSVSHDKHMRVIIRRARPKMDSESDPLLDQYLRTLKGENENYGFQKVEILENNIGYVDFRYFASPVKAADRVVAVMDFLKYSDAIIYDLRKNGGGNPEMIQLMCSYLFDEKIHLNSLYWREGDKIVEYWTLDEVEGMRMPAIPVYVLTSDYTFSGAEEFTYNLKTRNRATIIGETTGGGANPGGVHPITEHFGMFIPGGRAINPVTGTNWEGTGVEPDIKVDSDSALVIAIREAIPKAEKYRLSKIDKAESLLADIKSTEITVDKLIRGGNIDQATNIFEQALANGVNQKVLNEMDINRMGYDYLRKDKIETAIIVFKFNVKSYPDAYNTFDSLGEAYMKSGDIELAIKNYKKSLKLNPQNDNAVKMLDQLKVN